MKYALTLGADFVATGHYCRKAITKDAEQQACFHLLAGKDGNKDQSYFLCQLTQAQLSKALFPIGELTKPEVRAIAKEQNLITADKKDSQGLCFIGKVKLPDFLQQQLQPKRGDVILIPDKQATIYPTAIDNCTPEQLETYTSGNHFSATDGKKIGNHNGAHYYTIGQRKGIGIGGFELPLFVVQTDTKNNLLFLGEGEQHYALNRKGLFIENQDIHWLRPDLALENGQKARYTARIRYRQALEKCCLYKTEEGMYIIFENLQKGIAPGQFCAWYACEELVGSGVIAR